MRIRRSRWRMGLAAALLTTLLALGAAPAQKPAKLPALTITSPKAGQLVRAMEVNIAASVKNGPKGSQVEFLMDGVSLARRTKPSIKVADLSPGEHRIEAELLQSTSTALTPPVKASVSFRYELPAKPGKVSKDAVRAPGAGGAAGASPAARGPAAKITGKLSGLNIITNAVTLVKSDGAEVALTVTPASKLTLNGNAVSVGAFLVRTGIAVTVEYDTGNNTVISMAGQD